MSNQPVSHSERGEWWGTFFPTTNELEHRVAGQLTYDPRGGIELEFFEAFSDSPLKNTEVIFGILGGRKKQLVTLKITLNAEQVVYGRTLGGVGTGKSIYVHWAIFGIWLESDSMISEARFQQSHLEKLLGDDPRDLDQPKYQRPHEWHPYRSGGVAVDWSPVGTFISADHLMVYGAEDEKLSGFRKLQETIKSFNHSLLLKSETNPLIAYRSVNGLSAEEIEHFCEDVLSFICLLTNKNPSVELVSVVSGEKHGTFLSGNLRPYPTVRTGEDLLIHGMLPINGSKVDLGKIFAEWKEFSEISTAVSTSIRFGGTIEMHLVFLLMGLEAINKSDGGEDREKYEMPVNNYLTADARRKLVDIKRKFDPDAEIGKFLSDLRANFVHINDDTIDMSFEDMIVVRDIFIALITKFVLTKTSLEAELIDAHQQHFLRNLFRYEETIQ